MKVSFVYIFFWFPFFIVITFVIDGLGQMQVGLSFSTFLVNRKIWLKLSNFQPDHRSLIRGQLSSNLGRR